MKSIGTTRVEDVMITALISVLETDKMEEVVKVFDAQDIHAAPVLNKHGECVGIITSHDIVEYESVRRETQNELRHGKAFDLAHYGSNLEVRWPSPCFDEVGFHMSKQIDSANPSDSLSFVAKLMCAKHRHHVLILDNAAKPIGMLSSLDVLGFITGEPVRRSATRNTDDNDLPNEFLMGHADFDEVTTDEPH